MLKFKVGDIVEVVNDADCNFKEGDIVEVIEVKALRALCPYRVRSNTIRPNDSFLMFENELKEIDKVITNKTRGFEIVSDSKRKTNGEIQLPTRGTSKAMAYDFYSPIDLVIKPNEIGKVWTDVKAYMQGTEGLILNVRSSMGGKAMLANTQGWIDSDYYSNENNDGNIGIFLKNIGDEDYIIKKGDRIAQGAFFNFLVSDNGNTYNERKGGFGSSGK